MTNEKQNLIDLLALALPYVEDAITDPVYSASGQKRIEKLARDIREAVEKN